MTELTAQSLPYNHDGTELIGYLVHAEGEPRPGVLLLHDAFGVSEPMKAAARRIAELGCTVLLADLWGEGATPSGDDEIGPLIGSLVSDRSEWVGRVRAGHDALIAQAEVVQGPVTAVGYCFGGSSALEYLRHGGELAGVVSFHGGLDAVGRDWSRGFRDAQVLVLTGAEDPMARKEALDALQSGMTATGIGWEVSVYGATKHAFTDPRADEAGRPEVIAYDERAARRSWAAFTRFLAEVHEGAGARA